MTAVVETQPAPPSGRAAAASPPSTSSARDALAVVVGGRTLRACAHQVAGHLFESESREKEGLARVA